MRVSKVYNLSLLQIIAREGKITYDKLKKEYCVPTPPGVISGNNVMFDYDFKKIRSRRLHMYRR